MAKKEVAWETVQSGRDKTVERFPVPGGWLYCVTEHGTMGSILNQMLAFVPAPPDPS